MKAVIIKEQGAVVGASLAVRSLKMKKMQEIKQATLFGFDLVLKVSRDLSDLDKEIINENTLKKHINSEINKKISDIKFDLLSAIGMKLEWSEKVFLQKDEIDKIVSNHLISD